MNHSTREIYAVESSINVLMITMKDEEANGTLVAWCEENLDALFSAFKALDEFNKFLEEDKIEI